jgi:hypothetical protein
MSIAVNVQAKYLFDDGGIYRFAFNKIGKCGFGIGALHGSRSVLQHMQNGDWDDIYWQLERKSENVFSVRNYKTRQYITFDTICTRDHYNVCLTDSACGDSSLWRFDQYGNSLVLTNVADTLYKLAIKSGTYRIGAEKHAGLPLAMCYFKLYDRSGRLFLEDEERRLDVVNYFDYLHFDGVQPVYDKRNKVLMLSVSPRYMNSRNYRVRVNLATPSRHWLFINSQRKGDGDLVSFSTLNPQRRYKLVVRTDTGVAAESEMIVTYMPVIRITGYDFTHTEFKASSFAISDADHPENNDSLYASVMRTRGATSFSSGREKKGYAVKLTDARGGKIDRRIHGLRSDNYWVLDPMALDVGRVRNPSAFKIWERISRDTECYYSAEEPKRQKASRGFFAEVLLNGEYNGIYNVMERSDRKQFKLKKFKETDSTKTVRGLLYKSKGWNRGVQMIYGSHTQPAYSNTEATWDGWEASYPDVKEGEPFDWGPLWRAVQFVAFSSKADFSKRIWTYFDRPVMINFFLLVDFLYGYDNVRNNVYYMVYDATRDSMLTYAPWDMDCDIGRGWGGSVGAEQSPEINVDDYYVNYFGIYRRMLRDYPGFHDIMCRRYAVLRQYAFNVDSLLSIYNNTFDFYKKCGADQREYDRWKNSSGLKPIFEEDRTYINDWIPRRIATLDKKYAYDATGVAAVKPSQSMEVYSSPAGIYVSSPVAATVSIFDVSGRLYRRAAVEPGGTTVELPAGIYIVNHKKYMVK